MASDSSDLGTQGKLYRFADLFAGIGGIRKGFESDGVCVFTSEIDEYARATYKANYPDDTHEISGDICKIKSEDIPDFDVLLGGFPCQPFSIAGVSKKNSLGRPTGFKDKVSGHLFFEILRILDDKKPSAFLLENVKNILRHDRGKTFDRIMSELGKLGYSVYPIIIDAKRFVPQHRERVLFAGFRGNVGFSWPEPEGDFPHLKKILHNSEGGFCQSDIGVYVNKAGKPLPKYSLSPALWKYLREYAEKHRALGHGFGCSLVGPEDVARTLSARYYKDGSEILIKRRTSTPRRLTPRECARLMGFDDSWIIPVSDTRAYKQFGNSVVVPVMKFAADAMRDSILKAMALKDSR